MTTSGAESFNRPASPLGAPAAPDLRRFQALYAVSRLGASATDPEAALREMLQLFITIFSADAGSIALLSRDSGRLEIAAQCGAHAGPEPHGLKPGHGVTGWCVFNRRSLLVPDVTQEPRYIVVRKSARCEMAAPMQDGEIMIGVVDLEHDRIGGFSPEDLLLLEALAAEGARVLQRLWLVQHLQGKARQLESLITAGQSLVTKIEQQELFDNLTKETRHMMQARACALYLHDPVEAGVRCVSISTERGPPRMAQGLLPLDSSLVGGAIHTRRPITFADIQSPEFRELSDLPEDTTLTSVLATPMMVENDVLGVVAVFTDRIRLFDNDEKRLCAALASLGAVALQNARLYARVFQSEDVLRKNERLTTLGLLAAEIAHEIRNPLTVLKLLHGGLGSDFPADDPRQTDMRVISEKLDQLEAIVTKVLGFAKAPSNLHSRWSLTDIVEDTLVLVRLKLAQGKVTLHFHPPERSVFIDAHKGQIQQVLLNLLLNATEAMPEGGAITITATVEDRPGPRVILDIADTGSGIPAAIRDRIFDTFLSGRPDGTGLGLAVAKRILLGHHGDITLLSSNSAGTTMRVVLPLAP